MRPTLTASRMGPNRPNRPAPPPAQTPPPQAQTPTPPAQTPAPHGEHDRDDTPRASAGTYDRFLASLADIGQVPFLFRFNAYPEAYLDSLENPAYATEFRSAEGRVFILPT